MIKEANPAARMAAMRAMAGRGLRVARGPALGIAGGAGGLYGLQAAGRQQQESQQQAQEMRQLLQAYPELLYSMPGAGGMGMDPYAEQMQMQMQQPMQQMPFEDMTGYGYY